MNFGVGDVVRVYNEGAALLYQITEIVEFARPYAYVSYYPGSINIDSYFLEQLRLVPALELLAMESE